MEHLLLDVDVNNKNNILNKDYENFLKQMNGDNRLCKERLDIYKYIFEVMKYDNKQNLMNEIKYRVTDNENFNEVILSILEKDGDLMSKLLFIKNRLTGFLIEDKIREKII